MAANAEIWKRFCQLCGLRKAGPFAISVDEVTTPCV